MLRADPSLNDVPLRRDQVIAVFESINQPLVNIPNQGTAPTGAFIVGTRAEQGAFTVYVVLHQPETRGLVVYASEPRRLAREQYPAEEADAIRFVESMGFMVDNVHFPTLGVAEQESVLGRIPTSRAHPPTMDLLDITGDWSRSADRGAAGSRAPARSAEADVDSIFGALSAAEGDVFRRAGIDGTSPPVPSHASSARSQPPLRSQPPIHSQAPAPFSPSALPAPSPVDRVQRPANVDSAALDRLGRLLATFVLPFVVLAVCVHGCRSTGETAGRALENHIQLGNRHLADGHWILAIETFAVVLADDERQPDALRGTAFAYLRIERVDEAEKFYRLAIAAQPKWSAAKNELAVVLLSRRACEEAEVLLREALADIFYPTPEFAEHNLARAIDCQGRRDQAIGLLRDLSVKRPHFCAGYLTLAELSAAAKNFETTIAACDGFQEKCERDEQIKNQVLPAQSALCYLRKGLAFAELGDVESARASFMRCETDGTHGSACRRSLEKLPP